MQYWTSETLEQRFNQLDGKTDPVFHINVPEDITHSITIVGDAKMGRINLRYSHSAGGELLQAGYVLDRRMLGNEETLYINYSSEEDLIPYSETISIEDALQIAIYFVKHKALPPLPDHLYWAGHGQL